VTGDVVCGVVLPAPPEDPHPAGGDAAQCAVVSLTGGAGGFIQGPGPVRVVADGDEGPPVDGVAHSFVGGVAEPHLLSVTLPTVRDLNYPQAGSSLLARMEPAIGGFGISWCRAACPPMGCTGHIPG
jgi:hypothetical protein